MSNKPNTTNKSDRNVDQKFQQVEFHKAYEEETTREILNREFKNSDNNKYNDEIIYKLLPHQKPIEEIIVNMREVFFTIIDILIDLDNPIPYIRSTPDRFFAFALLLILIGTLLLLFSNLMMSSKDKE